MSYSRKAFKLFSSFINRDTLFFNKAFTPSFPVAPTMTKASNGESNKTDMLWMANNLTNIMKKYQILHDNEVAKEISKTTLLCFNHTLEKARSTLSNEDESKAGEYVSRILADIEKSYGKVTSSSPSEIKKIAIEAYEIQSDAYNQGTWQQCKIALNAIKTAHELEPNNLTIMKKYEALSISMGVNPPGQEIVEYSENYKMKK